MDHDPVAAAIVSTIDIRRWWCGQGGVVMGYAWRVYPELRDEHVAGARLFANRASMVRAIAGGFSAKRIVEIGVAFGDFTQVLLDAFSPDEFVAYDLFDVEKYEVALGRNIQETFAAAGGTHYAYYRDRFRDHPGMQLVVGPSAETLPRAPSDYYDLIYIDGDHSYDGCLVDTQHAVRMIKDDGIIIFNDYIMHDVAADAPYGVVPVANDLIVNGGWEVIGFALEPGLYCDLAIRKPR